MRELDVRVLPPSQKHSSVHERLEQLDSGDTLRIVNDHDPRPLRYEIDEEYPGCFSWVYVECGPPIWRVDISRKQHIRRSVHVGTLAECQGLRVGEIRVASGTRETVDTLRAAATALLFVSGEGNVTTSGCSHSVHAGSAELVCRGEPCTIFAATDIHAFLVETKGHY